MDFDNLNLNTRKVLREPLGMSRLVQVLFAIIAFVNVSAFVTQLDIEIECPTRPSSDKNVTVPPENFTVSYEVQYPFDMSNTIVNPCENSSTYSYQAPSGLTGSPQFFVMVGVLSLLYAFTSTVGYLMFSNHYETITLLPMIDLIATLALCLFWFIASCSFASGVSFLKHTVTFRAIKQALCPGSAYQCRAVFTPVWRSLNVAILAGFTSFFLWGAGMWFVFKETTLHVPRDQFRQNLP